MTENVLITGGGGLLAINWAMEIRDRYAVTLGFHERRAAPSGVATRKLALDAPDSIIDDLHRIRPQLVVHAAGLTNVEECEANPALAHHVNVELAANVGVACARAAVPLVHISTDQLFSGDTPFADESQLVAPKNVYAQTKAEAELRVLSLCPGALVIRTNFFGWGPLFRRSFSDYIIDPLRGGRTVTLFDDVFYTPILIEKLVNAVHALVNLKASGIFHVVGDQRISKYGFGLEVARAFQLDSSLIRQGSILDNRGLAPRPLDMSLSNAKTCALLGHGLGNVDEHLERLSQQERSGLTEAISNL